METMMCLENYDLVAITETWWDESHDWHTVIEGYSLFRMDRQGRRGGRVALYVRKWIGCEELCLRNSHDQVESLWVKIRDRSSKGQLVVGVCYRLRGLKLARRHESFWPGQESTSTIPTALKKAAPRAAAPGIRPRPRTAQRSVVPPAERSGSSQAALAIAARPHTALRSGPTTRRFAPRAGHMAAGHAAPRAPHAAGTASRGRAPPPPTPRRAAQHEDLRARHRPSKGRARSRPGADVCPSPSPALRPGLRLTPRGTAVPAGNSGRGHGTPGADQQVPKKTAGAFWL